MKIILTFGLLAGLILFFIFLTAKPNLKDAEWVNLDVKYCAEKKGVIFVKSWSTNDETLLKDLKDAYNQVSIKGLSVAGYTKNNRVIVSTKNNGSWYLFLYAPSSARLREVGNPTASYSVDLNPRFYNTLNAKLTSLVDEPVFFNGPICNIWEDGTAPH